MQLKIILLNGSARLLLVARESSKTTFGLSTMDKHDNLDHSSLQMGTSHSY